MRKRGRNAKGLEIRQVQNAPEKGAKLMTTLIVQHTRDGFELDNIVSDVFLTLDMSMA